jgi:hypothetical protein
LRRPGWLLRSAMPIPLKRPSGPDDARQPELPDPGERVSFAAHIKPLFRERDRRSMSFAFELWSRDDVAARAHDIFDRLQNARTAAIMREILTRTGDYGPAPARAAR